MRAGRAHGDTEDDFVPLHDARRAGGELHGFCAAARGTGKSAQEDQGCGGECETHKSYVARPRMPRHPLIEGSPRNAAWAAWCPHRPWTPAPGEVEAEQR